MATHVLQFLKRNKDIPRGQITSTARKGTKWYDLANTGDRLVLTETVTGEKFGEAVCIGVQAVPYRAVLASPQINHCFNEAIKLNRNPVEHLSEALAAAYGPSDEKDLFTVLQFIVINE